MSDPQTNRPDTLEHHKLEHRALAVLRMLGRESSYMSNEEIVGCHFAQLGLVCSRAQVRECLAMLERTGLIEVSMVEKLTVIRLTEKGEEVSKGLVVVEGVLRPSVNCPY
jgi:DNA-binding PadR family transcriptional regulator